MNMEPPVSDMICTHFVAELLENVLRNVAEWITVHHEPVWHIVVEEDVEDGVWCVYVYQRPNCRSGK